MTSFPRSPRLGFKILSSILGRGEHDTLIGDYEEFYLETARTKGTAAARLWYWRQIARFFPAYFVHAWIRSGEVFKNHIITSLRNIRKHKGYSLLNVLGLAIGLAACLLLLLYTKDELSYDRFNDKADRTYRLMALMKRQGQDFNISGAGAPVAASLLRDFPEVEEAVRFRDTDSLRLKYGDLQFRENRVVHADPSFFKVFSVRLVRGDPQTALAEPRTMVLSRATAAKFFGSDDPVGKILRVDDREDYQVTGVFEDIPRPSHFHFDLIISLSTLAESRMPIWMTFNFPTYLVLRQDASVAELEAKLPAYLNSHLGTEVKTAMGTTLEEFLAKSETTLTYRLQPLTKIHLFSTGGMNEFEPGSDIKYVALFGLVALFILILAAENFVNLATARSAGRAKEVGLRKVLGSFRGSLIRQFLVEAVVLSLAAFALALGTVAIALPFFNRMAGKELGLAALGQPLTAAMALGLTLAIGLLAGAYPAFVLSAFRPSPVLRGRPASGVRGGGLRRTLVVFQFAVSVLLIIGTVVVFRQLRFIQATRLGFNKDQVLILNQADLLQDRAAVLKEEMLRHPQVLRASLSGYLPVPSSRRTRLPVAAEGDPEPGKANPLNIWTVDHDYLDTLEMKIVLGRNFSRSFPTDEGAVLVNQAAAKHFGYDAPLGRRLTTVDMDEGAEGMKARLTTFTIIGVVEDFHFESLRAAISPLVVRLGDDHGSLILRIRAGGVAAVLDDLRTRWRTLLPGEPFVFSFLDDRLDDMYKAEFRIGRVFGVFSGLAVFIGCLGLFGLASFTAAKRTKEIGIHRILGATVPTIVRKLVQEYIVLVVLANIIAGPVGYWVMSRWLGGFAYRTGIGWDIFAGTAFLTLAVAVLTVGYHSLKAASASPVSALRYE